MKKIIILVTTIIVIAISVLLFVNLKNEIIPIRNGKNNLFSFEKIDWNMTKEQMEKMQGLENDLLGNTVWVDFKGIKGITKSDISVMYEFGLKDKVVPQNLNFSKEETLQSIDIIKESYEQEFLDNLLLMADKSKVVSDSSTYKRYIVYIGENKIELIGNVEKNGITMNITKSDGYAALKENLFSIGSINWRLTRDKIKTNNKNMNIIYDAENEEMAPVGYTYDGIKDICKGKTAVVYYFNEDNSIKSILMDVDYSDESLKKAFEYFGIIANENETEWETSIDGAQVLLSINEEDETIDIFLYGNN